MNNEEPIKLSLYPDGVAPELENGDNIQASETAEVTDGGTKKRRRKLPIERDDFPAPPFPYSSSRRGKQCLINFANNNHITIQPN